MTLFDKIFLWLFLSASPLYRRINVNISHLKAILTAKLTIDNRRPSTFDQMQRRNEKKELNKSTLNTMLSSLLVGGIVLLSFGISPDLTGRLTLYFSMFIFFLAATLISDFTSVLIDVKDNYIIVPKPVNDATFVTYRLLHISIHISKVLLPMLSPAIIFFFFKGLSMVVIPFTLMAFMATLFTIFLVNAIYILILKITTPEKFKSIISYIQIAFAVIIYGSYQFLPRLADAPAGNNLQMSQLTYIRFLPPFWFAETCNSFYTFSFGNMQLLSLALSITVPVLSMVLVIKFLAPSFTQKLSLINSSAAEIKNADPEKSHSAKRQSSWVEYLAGKITSGTDELTGFLFTWKMMGRSREFKIRVYPTLGYVLVIFLLLTLDGKSGSLSEITSLSGKGKIFLVLLIYFTSLISITALAQLSTSEKYRASWIFNVAPLISPGPVITGALKSVIFSFVLPFFLFFFLLGIPAVGLKIVPHILLGFINVIALCSMLAYFLLKNLPFTQPPSTTGSFSFINTMLTLVLSFVFGFVHLTFFDKPIVLVIVCLISIALNLFFFTLIRKNQWENVPGTVK